MILLRQANHPTDNRDMTKQLDLFAPAEPEESTTEHVEVKDNPYTGAWKSEWDRLPDVRDGLTREQRVILYTLYEAEKERPGKRVPTLMLYGRVCERIPMTKDRFKALLANLVGRGVPEL